MEVITEGGLKPFSLAQEVFLKQFCGLKMVKYQKMSQKNPDLQLLRKSWDIWWYLVAPPIILIPWNKPATDPLKALGHPPLSSPRLCVLGRRSGGCRGHGTVHGLALARGGVPAASEAPARQLPALASPKQWPRGASL